MPDTWEVRWEFLDPNDPRDAEFDSNLNGTLNLDEYKFRDYPGPDFVGHKKRNLMKPLWKWSDDEIISLLDDQAASDVFFRIIPNAYGRHRGYNGEKAIESLKAAYQEGVESLKTDGEIPAFFHAGLRWLHKSDPVAFPVVDFVSIANEKTYFTAFASLRDKPLRREEITALIQMFYNLHDDRKVAVVQLLAANDSPPVREFLLSPSFRQSIKNPRVWALIEGAVTSLANKTTYDRWPKPRKSDIPTPNAEGRSKQEESVVQEQEDAQDGTINIMAVALSAARQEISSTSTAPTSSSAQPLLADKLEHTQAPSDTDRPQHRFMVHAIMGLVVLITLGCTVMLLRRRK